MLAAESSDRWILDLKQCLDIGTTQTCLCMFALLNSCFL